MPRQREARERAALGDHLALALHHVQVEAGLLVGVGRERLRRAARDRRVARDQLLDHAAHHLEPERQRHHVEQQHVVAHAVAGEDVGLHRRAERDDLIGIDVGERRAPEQPRDEARTSGMRVAPPTRITPTSAAASSPASLSARRTASRSGRAPAAPAPPSRRASASPSRVRRAVEPRRQRRVGALRGGQRFLDRARGVQRAPREARVAAGVVGQAQRRAADGARSRDRSRRRRARSRRRSTSPRTRRPRASGSRCRTCRRRDRRPRTSPRRRLSRP